MELGLHGRRVLITGGSRGIGRSIARAFVAEGAQVAMCGRTAASLDTMRAELGDACHTAVVDAADHAALAAWVVASAEVLGGVDIVISNVSALGGTPRTPDGWRKNFDVDILSSVTLVDAALPFLVESDAASIVQIGTITAVEFHGYPGGGFSYGAIKAALVNYMSQLAIEYAPQGIRANTVSPGPIYIEDGSWGKIEKRMPAYFQENVDHQPQGRLGSPEEVARVVTFLASPAASWVTGENIIVVAGCTCRHAW